MINVGLYKKYKKVTIDETKNSNQHISLIGESGSGKSLMIQRLVTEIMEYQKIKTIIIMDIHGIFSDDQIDSAFLEPIKHNIHDIDVLNDGIQYDLFNPITYPDGTKEHDSICTANILDIFTNVFQLQCRQQYQLRTALEYVFERGLFKKHGFKSIYDALMDTGDDVAISVANKIHYLAKFNVFRDGTELFKEGKINVFRLSRLPMNTQPEMEEIILQLFWRLANTNMFKEHPIYIVCDEVQTLPQKKDSAVPILLSEGRKYGINLILSTQILKKDTSSALFQRIGQVGTKMYFRQPSERVPLIAKIIDANEVDIYVRLLKRLKVGEYVCDSNLLVDGRPSSNPIVIYNNLDNRSTNEHANDARENHRGEVHMPK